MIYVRLLSAVVASAGFVMFAATPALAADAARGQETYDRVGCALCHGSVGQGPVSGPKLAPDPLPFVAIRDYIRAPAQIMPPYREATLSDEEIADIHAYLESIPPAPDLEDTILAE